MANGFLEGLARRRRKAGLPALAIAWGAIEDVGVLARKSAVRDSLAKRVGVQGIKAREGLDLMAETIALLPADQTSSVIAIAPIDWASARQHLVVLNSPSYARLPRNETELHEFAQLDIRGLLAQKTPAEVSKVVADEIIEQIAKVLRLPRDDVARNKPLAEIGLDSLMAVELALALEQRFGLGGPMTSLASGLTAMEVADHVIGLLTDNVSEKDAHAKGLAERHLGTSFDAAALSGLKDRVFEKSDSLKDILP
jgi:acyl carrier protein